MKEDKKVTILAVLEILKKYTDEDHPMVYDKIIYHLDKDYNLSLERKALGRTIQSLEDFGYDIVTGKSGTYIASREFDDSELKLLIDDVLSNRYIPSSNSKQLIEKLMGLSNEKLKRHTKYVYSLKDWAKSPNKEFFYNIEIIDEAIANDKQITFDYNNYNEFGELVPRHLDRKSIVSPYRMVVKNQRYYLMCKDMRKNDLAYYKIDKITNIKLLDIAAEDINTIESFNNGINNSVLSNALPYMFSDRPKNVDLIVNDEAGVDCVVDWFGKNAKFLKLPDGKYRVTVKVSLLAMRYWALQYVDVIKVIAPKELKMDIKNELEKGLKNYQ
ncbi:MAG: WYL domain-containing protein [Clostridia bacterium]|nr:WYL domain-containing protein [Clostridia bacterium]